jgi:nucleosome assembly protein 1-like 1
MSFQFLVKQQVLNHRRLEIISGGRPTLTELSAGAEDMHDDDKDYKPPPLDPDNTAPIRDFWLIVIRNHVELGTMVEEKDVPALQSLIDIQFSFLYPTGPKPDFKLEFRFEANDFFINDVLEKTYYYKDEPDEFGDFQSDRSVGTNIQWKDGRKLTKDKGDDDGMLDRDVPIN